MSEAWVYRVAGGYLSLADEYSAICYSGRVEWKNNPEFQSVPFGGPIPCGRYYMVRVNGQKGPFTIHLLPDPANQMFGRSGFLVHGDSVEAPGEASEGCIVAPLAVRMEMAAGIKEGCVVLDVVTGLERV